MPNWLYLLFSFVYTAGLALWIGGTVVLGALVAPSLFRELERAEAGKIFGGILRRFARIRLVALGFVLAAAGCRAAFWEFSGSSSGSPWIAVRWVFLLIMAVSVFFELFVVESAIENARAAASAAGTPPGEQFQRLHRRAEQNLKLGTLAACGALFLN